MILCSCELTFQLESTQSVIIYVQVYLFPSHYMNAVGVRNDGFQYAFVSLGNKLGMAIGTSALAGVLSALSFAPNQVQNAAVQNAMHYAFSLLPGVLWLITAIVLFFYRISKRSYNQIMSELNAKKAG